MEKRLLGKTGIEVSVLGLGTWVFGGVGWGGAEDSESIAVIEKALEMGINFFDTAPAYGAGKAEELLGMTVKDKDRVVIGTKAHNLGAEIENSLDASLSRLKMDYVDIFYIHWPPVSGISIKSTMEQMGRLKKKGKIKAIGVSNFNLYQLKEAVSYVRVDVLQPPYNLFWRFAEDDLIPFCIEHDIAVTGYSPLARGILSGKFNKDWKFKEGDDRPSNVLFLKEHFGRVLESVNKIKQLAETKKSSIASMVIKWTVLQPGITSTFIGARNVSQLTENMNSLDVSLSNDDLKRLNEISNDVLTPVREKSYTNPFNLDR